MPRRVDGEGKSCPQAALFDVLSRSDAADVDASSIVPVRRAQTAAASPASSRRAKMMRRENVRFAAATVAIVAAVGLLSMYALGRKRRSKRTPSSRRRRRLDLDLNLDAEDLQRLAATGTIGDDDRLRQIFKRAAAIAPTLPRESLSQVDRLMLYGLYKQATVGERGGDPPPKMNLVASAKYDAWGKFSGMPRPVAMLQYVEVVKHFAEGGASATMSAQDVADDNADIVYDDDDDEYDEDDEEDEEDIIAKGRAPSKGMEDVGMSGMGLRPSTLRHHEDGSGSVRGKEKGEEGTSALSPEERLRSGATSGDIAAIKAALADGADVDSSDESGQTALHFAADRCCGPSVAALLAAGANPNAADREGISVLQAAVIGGDVDAVRILLKAGADPDHEDIDGDTPRSCAEDDGTEEMKEAFLIGSE